MILGGHWEKTVTYKSRTEVGADPALDLGSRSCRTEYVSVVETVRSGVFCDDTPGKLLQSVRSCESTRVSNREALGVWGSGPPEQGCVVDGGLGASQPSSSSVPWLKSASESY